MHYNEEIPLTYPATAAEFALLERDDIEFDESRAKQPGCPLRHPANEEEWKAANLEGIFLR